MRSILACHDRLAARSGTIRDQKGVCLERKAAATIRGSGRPAGAGGQGSRHQPRLDDRHPPVASFDSMMTHCADPRNTPEMLILREEMRGWRSYDHFRTDAMAPARIPQIGTHTPILSHDGGDSAAALQTIREIGNSDAINDAFPGGRVAVSFDNGWFEVEMQQHGLLRPLKAAELSDGTLRYLLWMAALLTPRPPGLLVLNEPATSLCSHLAMRGAPPRAIQELAGHRELGMTQRYMHLSPAALDSAIRLLDQPLAVQSFGDIWRRGGSPKDD
jgi:predicted ATPase